MCLPNHDCFEGRTRHLRFRSKSTPPFPLPPRSLHAHVRTQRQHGVDIEQTKAFEYTPEVQRAPCSSQMVIQLVGSVPALRRPAIISMGSSCLTAIVRRPRAHGHCPLSLGGSRRSMWKEAFAHHLLSKHGVGGIIDISPTSSMHGPFNHSTPHLPRASF